MFSRTYIIPPAIIAGVVAGSAMWLIFIAVYKLLLKRLRPRLQQREATGVEGAEAESTNNNSELHQIATIPRARLVNTSKSAAGTQFNRKCFSINFSLKSGMRLNFDFGTFLHFQFLTSS